MQHFWQFFTSLLHYCAFLEDTNAEELARIMVLAGADPNAVCFPIDEASHHRFVAENHLLSGSPLHWAVYYNRVRFAATLLELGAKASQPEGKYPSMLDDLFGVVTTESFKTTPMYLAAELHRFRLLELLVENHQHTGGDTNALPAAKIALQGSELRMM